MPPSVVLALDTGSPRVSVAVGRDGSLLAQRSLTSRQASEQLWELVAAVLAEAQLDRRALEGVIALRGPGSFTGLRIGLASALALGEALDIPATALPTLAVLASTVTASASPDRTVAAVDALRGEWFFQLFSGSGGDVEAAGEPQRGSLRQLAALGAVRAVGFGLPAAVAAAVTTTAEPTDSAIAVSEPPPLAAAALRWIVARPPDEPWDRGLLSAPLYLRAPNIRRPPARGHGQR